MAHGRGIVRGRDKQQVDGLLHERASGDVYIRSVFRESSVQRTEGIAADIKVAAEVRFNRCGIAGNLRGETVDLHPIGQFAQQRELARKAPVHKHELAGNARNPVRLQFLLGQLGAAVPREPEGSLRDGGDVGEPPVFVVSGWETRLRKSGQTHPGAASATMAGHGRRQTSRTR